MQKQLTRLMLTSMLVLISIITLVASTFAWVGLYTHSTFQEFEVDLKVEELEEYGIEISLDGKNFSSGIDQDELKKQILVNLGYNKDILDSYSKEKLRNEFANVTFDQATVIPSGNDLINFTDIRNRSTNKYIKFDFYLSAFKNEIGPSTGGSEYFMDAYLSGELFSGTKHEYKLPESFTYPTNFINPAVNGISGGTTVGDNLVMVDSSSVVRCAFSKHKVVERGKPELYNSNLGTNDLIIYQGGTAMPTYDPVSKVYSFGGVLEKDKNVAIHDWNSTHEEKRDNPPQEILNRGDIEFKSSNLNQIISSQKEEEKVGINTMIKITTYFWFEGWDADCFAVVDRSPVKLAITFSANKGK